VLDYAGACRSAATGRYPPFFHGLLDRGVAIAPGAYEVMFPSLAHTDADIEATVAAAEETAERIVAGS
jgi:glutamate-1-semialdehyde 2,1-aminomutase